MTGPRDPVVKVAQQLARARRLRTPEQTLFVDGFCTRWLNSGDDLGAHPRAWRDGYEAAARERTLRTSLAAADLEGDDDEDEDVAEE